MLLRLVLAVGSLLLLNVPVFASLAPNDVVVVYNSNIAWNTGQRQSKAVADYYCQRRGIPLTNECGVDWPSTDETINPSDFATYILNDQGSNPGLRSFLSARPGFDVDDPGSDPTKCIVLCYGIPLRIEGGGRISCVDTSLALLFNETPWGHLPIGGYWGAGSVTNPYFEDQADPLLRTKPASFDHFRASDYNCTTETPPSFTIVRMFDNTHALAAGGQGMLFRGEHVLDHWEWTAVSDPAKGFIAHKVTDISVVSPQVAYVCTEIGGVLRTTACARVS